jgi:hypothetical protein
LRSVEDNPHATLITFFLTAVEDIGHAHTSREMSNRIIQFLDQSGYMMFREVPKSQWTIQAFLAYAAAPIFRDNGKYFQK